MFRARISCLLITIFWICPGAAAESPEPRQADENLESSPARHVWRVDEVWSAGDEDDDVIFGAVTGIAADDDGRIHVLDGQLSIIHVFGPDGDRLDARSHEGDGPGESRRPAGLCLLEPNRFGMVHPFPGRVVTFGLDGTPAGDIHYYPVDDSSCGVMVLRWLSAAEDLLVLGGFCMESDGKSGKSGNAQVDFVSRCAPDGRELGRYLERHRTVDYSGRVIDEMDQDEIWQRAALGSDGRLYIAPDRNAYLVQVFGPDGSMQCKLEREMDGLPRSTERLASVRRDLEAWSRYYKNPPSEIRYCPSEPCITGLWPRPNGELWVRTSRGDHPATPGAAIVLDAYDSEGRFLHQVSLECPFDPYRDVLRPLGTDRLIVIRNGSEATLDLKGNARPNEGNGPVVVTCYRLDAASH